MGYSIKLPMPQKALAILIYFGMWILTFVSTYQLSAQSIQQGFDPNEYAEFLRITARQRGPIPDTLYPKPLKYDLIYNSPSLGLDNGWQLWVSKDEISHKSAVLSLRATTSKQSSWLENLYAATIKAKGKITISKDFDFSYKLAEHPQASIHVGWLIGLGYLQKDIQPKLDSCYQAGIKDFYIFGHSQGGAISFLLTSYYHYLQKEGKIPSDIRFKTYCSAAPKPGNLFYAYDYESFTQNGWAYNVINSEDWVPETPVSVQSTKDFSSSNPFKYLKEGTEDLPWLKRWVVRGKFNGMNRKMEKAQKKFTKIMGNQIQGLVRGYLEELEKDIVYDRINYQRCGNTISLVAEETYFSYFPENNPDVFRNHMMDAYQIVLEIYYKEQMNEEYIIYTNNAFPFYLDPEIPKLPEDKDQNSN